MEKGSIPDIFDRSCNLLWYMEDEMKRTAVDYLEEMIPGLRESMGTIECLETWMDEFGYSEYDSDDASDDGAEWCYIEGWERIRFDRS